MSKRTTIHDIASELKTNVSTVSRALNDHPAISIATKEAVKRMALKLNYQQNKIASSLRSGKTHNIGIIIPSTDLSFFGSVIHGIEQVMNRAGYNILLFQSNESFQHECKGIEVFLQSRVDGIIASIAMETQDFQFYKEIKKRQVPLVLFDRTNQDLQVPSVTINDFKGGFEATEHLILQGYKRIAHISAKQKINIFTDRLSGYRAALEKYNIAFDNALLVYGNVSIEAGRTCTAQLLNLPQPPDGIFAVADFTALGAIQQCKIAGIKVPQQMGIIGFANESFSEYITPSLSTIDQQTKRMGEEAANLFLNQIKDFNLQKLTENIVLNPILVARESTAKK